MTAFRIFGAVNCVKSKTNKLTKLFQEGVRKRSFTGLTSKVSSYCPFLGVYHSETNTPAYTRPAVVIQLNIEESMDESWLKIRLCGLPASHCMTGSSIMGRDKGLSLHMNIKCYMEPYHPRTFAPQRYDCS